MLKPIALAALAAVALSACSIDASSSESATASKRKLLSDHYGDACTVQLVRSRLGYSGEIAVPATSNGINGADLSIQGRLLAFDTDGALLEGTGAAGGKAWIPAENILLISFP